MAGECLMRNVEPPLACKSVGAIYLCCKPMPSKRISLLISVF
jgi:hypothetical protein